MFFQLWLILKEMFACFCILCEKNFSWLRGKLCINFFIVIPGSKNYSELLTGLRTPLKKMGVKYYNLASARVLGLSGRRMKFWGKSSEDASWATRVNAFSSLIFIIYFNWRERVCISLIKLFLCIIRLPQKTKHRFKSRSN